MDVSLSDRASPPCCHPLCPGSRRLCRLERKWGRNVAGTWGWSRNSQTAGLKEVKKAGQGKRWGVLASFQNQANISCSKMDTDSLKVYIPWGPVPSWDGRQTCPLTDSCWRSACETVTPAWLVSWIQSPPEKRNESMLSTFHNACQSTWF